MSGLAEAQRMVEVFASVGAERFYVTKTDILERKTRAWPASLERLRETLAPITRTAARRKPCDIGEGRMIRAGENVIVRPMSRSVTFIQLDDLAGPALERVRAAAFLTIATSPGNHQAWIAVTGMSDKPAQEVKDFVRRVKKGIGDESASGAVRLAGTDNFKVKYMPAFPTVNIVEATPGRTVTPAQLEAMGLVAAPEQVKAAPAAAIRVSRRGSGERSWPDYQRCIQQAPINNGKTGPDISKADFFWCFLAAQRGWTADEIAAKLSELSGKARENGERYALLTAQNATAAAEHNRKQRAGGAVNNRGL